jgi:hypothetical protein
MKIEDIQTQWEQDAAIDRSELGEESLKIPQLHSKYFKVFSHERLILKKLEQDYKSMYRKKFEYYNGTMSYEDLKNNGWEPNPLRILKSEAPLYINSDRDIAELQLKIDLQNEKIYLLENIIKSINNRNFMLKNAIDFLKFQNGL